MAQKFRTSLSLTDKGFYQPDNQSLALSGDTRIADSGTISYISDLSGTYTCRSLPDVEYVDNIISGVTGVIYLEPLGIGAFLDSPVTSISTSGGTVYGMVSGVTGSLRIKFENTVITRTGVDSIALVNGTDKFPTENYVWYTSGGTLTSGVEYFGGAIGTNDLFAPVMRVLVQSVSGVTADGVYKQHAYTDHIRKENGRGNLSHINERIREESARWFSGIVPSVDIVDNTPDDVLFSTTNGYVFQLHSHTFPAFPTGSTIFVANKYNDNYFKINNLNGIRENSDGGALTNYFSFVIWGVQSENGLYSKIYLNVPKGDYVSESKAIEDLSNFTIYTIPRVFNGTSFLIARVILKYSPAGGGTYTLTDVEDLRGIEPASKTGGGSGTVEVKESIEFDSIDDKLHLVGDTLTPVAGQFYGYSGGTRGWYIPSGGTGTITGGGNGLSTSGNTIVLGGTLTGNTLIDGGHNICIYTTGNNIFGSNSGVCCAIINSIPTGALISKVTSGIGTLEISLDKVGGISISDSMYSKGAVYSNNYSTSGTIDPRWIPDYAAVTGYTQSQISGATGTITGATNIGAGSGVYSATSDKALELRSLVGCGGTIINVVGNEIHVCSTDPTGTTVAWGSVTGNITGQTDLYNSLTTLSGYTGGLTDNYVPYWNNTGFTNSNLFITGTTGGTFIGINRTDPEYDVDICGSLRVMGTGVVGQSLINDGLIVNNSGGGLAIDDFVVKTENYCSLYSSASGDSLTMMSDPSGCVGFFGCTPTTQSTGWAATGGSTTKTYTISATTFNELSSVVAAMMSELVCKGIISS